MVSTLRDWALKGTLLQIVSYLFLFLIITTLHLEVGLLKKVKIEVLTLLGSLGLFASGFFLLPKKSFGENQKGFFLAYGLVFLIALVPVLSSFYNFNTFEILVRPEYKSWVKFLLFCPLIFFLCNTDKKKDLFMSLSVFFFFLLALTFIYRYKVLNEVRDFDLRPTLNMRHGDPNFLATFFCGIFPWGMYLGNKWGRDGKRFLSWAFYGLSAVILISIILTESRMGIISLSATCLYLLWKAEWKISKKKLMLLFAFAVTFTAPFVASRIKARFENMYDRSNELRVASLKNGVHMFWEEPLLGQGWGEAPKTFFEHGVYPDFQTILDPLEVHNTALEILAELGLVGFLLIGGLFLYSATYILAKTSISNMAIFTLASLIGIGLNSLTVGVAYKDLTFFFLLGNLALNVADRKNFGLFTS